MKSPAPYFRAFDGWWYVQLHVDGKRKQIKLAKGKGNEALAMQEWHKLCASQPVEHPVAAGSVLALLDLFLDHYQSEASEGTYTWYRNYFKSFKAWFVENELEELELEAFTPAHVTSSLKGQTTWSKSTKNHDRLPTAGSLPVRGAPFQPAMQRLVSPASESKGKEYPRVIYLNDVALAIVDRLCKKYPQGTILETGWGDLGIATRCGAASDGSARRSGTSVPIISATRLRPRPCGTWTPSPSAC